MCMLCIEILKGKITTKELARAYLEIEDSLEEGHKADIGYKLWKIGIFFEVDKEYELIKRNLNE